MEEYGGGSANSRPVGRVADPGVVIEEHTNTSVTKLEAKAILVAVINPLGDEHWVLLAGAQVRLLLAGHDG